MPSFLERLRTTVSVVKRIVGVPDYDAYVEHQREHHPECEVLSQKAFIEKAWEDKYSRPGTRCC
jgi:uncharacterized short protein YbdD (DUF466 family)